MKQLRFIPKEIAEIIASIQENPFVDDLEPRFEKGMLGDIGIYPSRTKKTMEYRCTVRKDEEEGPLGMCSCRGWAQAKKSTGPSKPCLHIIDNLLRQDWFKIEDVLEVALMEEAKEKAELKEKKKVAKAALATSDGEPKVETSTAIATVAPEGAWRFSASKTPLLVACPASWVRPSEDITTVRTSGQAASLGSVIHKAAEMIVGEGLTTPPDMSNDLEDAGITDPQLLADVPGLLWAVINEWNGSERDERDPMKSYFQTVDLEQRFTMNLNPKDPRTGERQAITVTAIFDFNGQTSKEGHWLIGDWKTNRKEDEPFYAEQMRMEAAVLMSNNKTVDMVTAVLVWLRHGARTVRTYSREDIRAWMKMLVKRKFFWDGKSYSTGEHCMYCPRVFTCEGRRTQLRNYIDVMGNVDPEMLLYDDAGVLLVPDEMNRRLQICKAFRKVDKGFNDALKQLLSESGGRPLEEMPGYELTLKEKRGSLKIDVESAWTTFMEFVTSDQIAPALTISKTALESAVKGAMKDCEACKGTGFTDENELIPCPVCDGKGEVEIYPRGKKGAVIKDLMQKLEDRGAAKRGNPSHEIVVAKIKKEKSDG